LSRMDLWVDVDSIDTHSTDRDAELCSAEFFDVARYPRAHFRSTSVTIGENEVLVSGPLSLHGVLHDVKLSITPMAMPESATIGQRETFTMKAKLNRKDFGLTWNVRSVELLDVAVADHIEVNARIEVVRSIDTLTAATR
jgi:polyisoprenoid-binding protein YceI